MFNTQMMQRNRSLAEEEALTQKDAIADIEAGNRRTFSLHAVASASWLAPGERPLAPPEGLLMSIGSAVLYGTMAVSMNFVNKATLQQFAYPSTILLIQMAAATLVLPPLKCMGVTSYPALSWHKAVSLMPVTLLYVSNVGFALLSIQYLNIPMYNSLRRLSPVLVLVEKAYMTRKWPRREITLSVVLVVSGCIIAGIGDFSFEIAGYLYAGVSCALQASYLILVERTGAKQGVGTDEMLLYNSILSIPCLALVVLVTGEAWVVGPGAARAVDRLGVVNFGLMLTWCSLLGVLLNYAMFLCTLHNSALTTTIVGVLKGVVATVLGFFLLGGVRFHPLNVIGIAVNTVGGTWYTVIKYHQRQERLQAAEAPGSPERSRLLPSSTADPKLYIKSSPVPEGPVL